MASTLAVPQRTVVKMRHSAHGVRTTDPHKQVRIERSKSTTPAIHVDSDPVEYTEESFDSDKKWQETTMFLTAARRMSYGPINRCQTPLEVQDLTEEELDSFYFDDEETETKCFKFDEKKNYISMCEEDDLLPSSSFLRQIDKPRCNLSCLALTEKDIRPIAISLVNNSKITEIDLSENDLGKFGVRHIAESLTENVFITHAKLSRVGMGADCVKHLVLGLKGNKTLTSLDLSQNHLNANSAVHIAKLIQENDFITELILRENDIDDEAGRVMARAIASNLTIRKLDLSWNHIRGKGASEVVTAICDNVELLDVDLSYNGLGEEGSIAFGKHFQKNHTLRMLDITNCRINFLHLGHILKGLKANDTLESLKITGNPFTTDGAIAILKCLENSSTSALKDLYLEDTPINDEFLMSYEDLQTKRNITIHHKEPNRKKISSILREKKIEDHDPLLLLFELMRQESFRLVDLFRNFDQNNDNRITKEELKNGFLKFSIELPEEKIDSLMNKLDLDADHAVDLSELISGRRRAAMARHNANKESTGRMAESLKHLKNMVEKVRKEKYQENHNVNRTDSKPSDKNSKQLNRRPSMTAIIQVPLELKEKVQAALK